MLISGETLCVIHLVARYQSITTAAERLNKIPSAISYTTKRAEESLDAKLFICKGRYIELSSAESYFIERSKATFGGPEALKHNTVPIHDGIERELTIVVDNIIPGGLLAVFIRDFERQFTSTAPTVDLEVYNGYWDMPHSKRADLAYGAPHAVPSSEGIISEPVGQMEWDFVVSPLHSLAAKRHPSESNGLRHYPVIYIRDTPANFPPMQAWLLEGQKPIFVPDFVTVITLIEQDVGIGYIPHHLAPPLLNGGKLLKKPICEYKHATRLFLTTCSDGIDKACQWRIEHLRDPQLMAQFVLN